MNILLKILRVIIGELKSYTIFILRGIPGASGCLLRYICYKPWFEEMGNKVYIPQSVYFKGVRNISIESGVRFGEFNKVYSESKTKEAKIQIGKGVTCNENVMLNADQKGTIIIEEDVLIGPNVVLRASGHEYKDPDVSIRSQGHTKGCIRVNKGAWIGANSVILPDVTVGEGAIVGAGAVVTKDVEDFTVVGGVPAIKIGERKKT